MYIMQQDGNNLTYQDSKYKDAMEAIFCARAYNNLSLA